jgi:hypothetical protein
VKQELYAQLKTNVECLKAGKPPKYKGVDIHDEMSYAANPLVLDADKWRCSECGAPATSKPMATGLSEASNSAACGSGVPQGRRAFASLLFRLVVVVRPVHGEPYGSLRHAVSGGAGHAGPPIGESTRHQDRAGGHSTGR